MGVIKVNGKIYTGLSGAASVIKYTGSNNLVNATTVQGAIDRLAESIDAIEENMANNEIIIELDNWIAANASNISANAVNISSNATSITNLSNTLNSKVPFRLGKDSSGNYGYYKDGADTVTPFKTDTSIQVVASATGKTGSTSAFTIHTTTQKWRELYVITNAMRTNAGATSTHSQGTQVLRGQCVDDPGYSYLHVTKLTNVAKGTAIKCALYYVYNFIILGVV